MNRQAHAVAVATPASSVGDGVNRCHWPSLRSVARIALLGTPLLLLFTPHVRASGGTTCSMSTPTVAFGVFNPLLASPTDTVGTISITCNQSNASSTITFDGGATGSAATWREMSHQPTTSIRLEYNLYSDSGRSVVWSSNSGGSGQGVSITTGAAGVAFSMSVYGRIRPGPQQTQRSALQPGSYLDNITVTYTF